MTLPADRRTDACNGCRPFFPEWEIALCVEIYSIHLVCNKTTFTLSRMGGWQDSATTFTLEFAEKNSCKEHTQGQKRHG